MNFEDLKVGMVIVDNRNEKRKITAVGKTNYLYLTEEGSECTGSNTVDYSEFKEKKKYWLWDLKDCNTKTLYKSIYYLNDQGKKTNGEPLSNLSDFEMVRKHENDFIEI